MIPQSTQSKFAVTRNQEFYRTNTHDTDARRKSSIGQLQSPSVDRSGVESILNKSKYSQFTKGSGTTVPIKQPLTKYEQEQIMIEQEMNNLASFSEQVKRVDKGSLSFGMPKLSADAYSMQ